MSRAQNIPLACPVCGEDLNVYDSHPEGTRVRRRRQCRNGHRFNTSESVVGEVRAQRNRRFVPDDKVEYDGTEEVEAGLLAERGW